ncbi:MAG: hypothetical protein CMO43_06760 [Verrucomicrobiales bacterium]|jgi:hypothetical protein|nr:hypothetical protein [Verrucomicrobiales bacterium]MDP6679099.1 hypothetical protein [Verrucomicrobiota bacterium]
MKSKIFPLLALALGLMAQNGQAAELTSGPPTGSPLAPVNSYALHGPHKGQEFDAAKALGQDPGALLFIHELTRNIIPVLRGLDDLTSEFSILGFQSHTLLLHDDRTAAENRLKAINGSLKLAHPIILSLDGLEGPGDYALNRRAALTLVLAKGGQVTRSIALTDTGQHSLPQLREWVEGVAGTIPADPETLKRLAADRLPVGPDALRELAVNQAVQLQRLRTRLARLDGGQMNKRMQSRRPQRMKRDAADTARRPAAESAPAKPAAKREGAPPEDAALQSSLRALIRKTNSDERIDEVFAEITARAAESAELTRQAREMFRLVLSLKDRYGTPHAHALAEGFLDKHPAKRSR